MKHFLPDETIIISNEFSVVSVPYVEAGATLDYELGIISIEGVVPGTIPYKTLVLQDMSIVRDTSNEILLVRR